MLATKTKVKNNTFSVAVDFTSQQKKGIEKIANLKGMTVSEFIRFEILSSVNQNTQKPTKKKHKLAKFAGVLSEEEAENLITDIYQNRHNKS